MHAGLSREYRMQTVREEECGHGKRSSLRRGTTSWSSFQSKYVYTRYLQSKDIYTRYFESEYKVRGIFRVNIYMQGTFRVDIYARYLQSEYIYKVLSEYIAFRVYIYICTRYLYIRHEDGLLQWALSSW